MQRRSFAKAGYPAVAVALALGLWLLGVPPAQADTLTQTITVYASGCCGAEFAYPALFDPALGTLDSVTITGTVTGTVYATVRRDIVWYRVYLDGPLPPSGASVLVAQADLPISDGAMPYTVTTSFISNPLPPTYFGFEGTGALG
ncbi:MAG: hypothetical protein ACREFP_18855, partial [Acetobacteraceae bacterium]